MPPNPDLAPTPLWLGVLIGVGLMVVGMGFVVAVMFAASAYNRWASGLGPRLATTLGFERGPLGLYADADGFPLNVAGGMIVYPQSSVHGVWRGRRAESVVIGGSRDAVLMGSFRVDLVEIPGRLPRVEFLARHRVSVVPLGGGTVVEVESEEFNRAFDVTSADPGYAHAVLQPRMIERLLRPDARDLSITVSGGAVFCWRPTPDGVVGARERLDVLSDIADLLPPFLEADFGLSSDLLGSRVVFLPDALDVGASAPQLARSLPRAFRRPAAPDADGTKNWMAGLGWALLATLVLWPVGVLMGHLALRAARAGHATNASSARAILYVGYGVAFFFLSLASCGPVDFTFGSPPPASATQSP